jgi:hypothetical protein
MPDTEELRDALQRMEARLTAIEQRLPMAEDERLKLKAAIFAFDAGIAMLAQHEVRVTSIEQRLARDDAAAAAIQRETMEPTHRLVFSLMTAFNDWNARLTAIEQRLARDDAAAAIQRGTMHRSDPDFDSGAFRVIEGDNPK